MKRGKAIGQKQRLWSNTHALLRGSPAIDSSNNSLIPGGVTSDHRGFLRIVNGAVDNGSFKFGDGVAVTVDIKPGKTPNSVNPNSGQEMPVAILTADTSYARDVNVESIEFGPLGALDSHGRAHLKDVDEDGDIDLILHFTAQETGIARGNFEAAMTGKTFGGQLFEGSDTTSSVNCP